jgi:hypothetical protein
MAEDPADIEARIAAARADLARTVDELVDRLSPKRVAARGQDALRAKLPGAGGSDPFGAPPASPVLLAAAGVLLLVGLFLIKRRRGR